MTQGDDVEDRRTRLHAEIDEFWSGVTAWEADEPDWFAHTVFDLVANGLDVICEAIESDDDDRASWSKPYTTSIVPVRWDSTTRRIMYNIQLSTSDLDQPESLDAKLHAWFATHRVVYALHQLTQGVAHYTEQGRTGVLLTQSMEDTLQGVGKDERAAFLDEVDRAYVVGLAPEHQREFLGEGPEAAYREALQRLRDTGDGLRLKIGWGPSEVLTVIPVVVICPLEIDADAEEAFFPLLLGIGFDSDVDPSSWTREERDEFWCGIIDEFKGTIDGLRQSDRLVGFATPPRSREDRQYVPRYLARLLAPPSERRKLLRGAEAELNRERVAREAAAGRLVRALELFTLIRSKRYPRPGTRFMNGTPRLSARLHVR